MKYNQSLIFCDNEVMLIERENEPAKGQLVGVGGHKEYFEDEIGGAHRELLEEAGFDCELKKLAKLTTISTDLYVGKVDVKPFDIRILDEGRIAWYKKDELINNEKLRNPIKSIVLSRI